MIAITKQQAREIGERIRDHAAAIMWAARCIVIGLSPFAGIALLLGLTPLAQTEAITITAAFLFALASVIVLGDLADDLYRYVIAFRRARRVARIRRAREDS
jgi:hypothetical protein